MTKAEPPLLPAILGLTVQGDLGPWTFYTSQRGNIVFYPRSPALQPATVDQATQRNKFRTAGHTWSSFTTATKSNWKTVSKLCNLRIDGWHLFTWWICTRDSACIRTLERNSGIKLLNTYDDPLN